MHIHLYPYNPAWPDLYLAEVARLRDLIGPMIARTEHIGSTAVPGLDAKPVIDVQVGVHDLPAFDAARDPALLTAGGYQHYPQYETDIPFRRFFTRDHDGQRQANIHLVAHDHPWFRRHVTLRDYLRASPDALLRYQAAKHDLARCDWPTVNDYAAAKTPIILQLEEEAFAHFNLPEPDRHQLRQSRI